MADREQRSPRNATAKSRSLPPDGAKAHPVHEAEAVDGILIRIHKTEFTIVGEQPGQSEHRHGYLVTVAIPDWDKNRSLLKSVKKGYKAQQTLLARLQREGASRRWLIQRFIEIDKAVAAILTTIAERIRTRRWRERERAGALQRLQAIFGDLQRWTAKATRYCERAERCADAAEKETILDAACLAILRVGELVTQVERMQHGFWEEFRAAHFLETRQMRNLIAHTDKLQGEEVIPIGTGICRDFKLALGRTLFPERADGGEEGFWIRGSEIGELEPARAGGKVRISNSIAMVAIDDRNRFVIYRVARGEDDEILISASATGRMNLRIDHFRYPSETESGS